jgi:hypothetical protein
VDKNNKNNNNPTPSAQAILDLYKPPSAKQLIRQVGISTLIIHATLSETEKLSVSGPLLPPLPHGRHR